MHFKFLALTAALMSLSGITHAAPAKPKAKPKPDVKTAASPSQSPAQGVLPLPGFGVLPSNLAMDV